MNVETHLIVIYKIQLSCVIEKYFQFYEHPESKERAQLVNGAFTCKYFYQTQATRHPPSFIQAIQGEEWIFWGSPNTILYRNLYQLATTLGLDSGHNIKQPTEN